MNKIAGIALFLIICGCFSSCSFRKLVKGKKPNVYELNNPDSGKAVVVTPPVLINADSLAHINDSTGMVRQLIDQLTPVWKSRLEYKSFTGKARMYMSGPDDNEEFTAHIRVRKDSVIWINITAMGGISFAKVFITRDSFFMLNHLQKTAICVPLSSAVKVLPTKVDFSSLQNLILGEPLRDGVITSVTATVELWDLLVLDSTYIQQVEYSKADSTMKTAVLRTQKPGGPVATTKYSDYETVDNRRVSTGRELSIRNGNDLYSLDMHFTKIDFDQQLDYPFSIPKSYTIKEP